MNEVALKISQQIPQQLIDYCKSSIQKGSKSFSLASFFFNEDQRIGSWLLYSWCRYSDDLIDKASDKSEAAKRLSELKRKTELCFSIKIEQIIDSTELDSPELKGLAFVAQKYQIPNKYALDLLRGMQMDIDSQKYESIEDLLDYCYCVAGTVGLMMCHIMGLSDQLALEQAVRMGNAMQLTNIARDVKDDWDLGRIYFPNQWLREYDLDETTFGQPQSKVLWSKLTKRLLAIADQNYYSGWSGLYALPFRAAIAVGVAARVYAKIGKKVLSAKENAWNQRRYVTLPEKISIALRTTFQIIIMMIPRIFNPWKATKINWVWGDK